MNIIRNNEELSYRILVGDNIINLEIATSISNNQINRNNVYIGICHQSGITSEIKTLSSWIQAVIKEINSMIRKKIQQDIKQNKSFRGEIDKSWNARFNSFSLTEALQTRAITYSYYKYDENLRPEDLYKDSHIIIEPTVKHTEQVKISDKLYDLLDSLTLFIPSDSNESNNVDYSLIICNRTNNKKHTHIFLTVHPATAQYEIVNKIDIVNMTSKSSKSNQQDHCCKNIGIVVIPASEHKSLIDRSNITMTRNYQFISIDRQQFNQDKIKDYIIINKLEIQNKQQDEETLQSKPWYIFKNIQWLHSNHKSKYEYLGTKSKDYLFDTATGYQVILDWSLIGRIDEYKRKFFLLHEQSINNQTKNIKDIWVYYESPSSSSSKTKLTYGYDEKTVATYSNLNEALNDLETKINSSCHQGDHINKVDMQNINSLYLLSKE